MLVEGDSSWATRFSVSGCLIFYHGCLFHWFSKMQKSVSLSSAEAEYFGAMRLSCGVELWCLLLSFSPRLAPCPRDMASLPGIL